MLIRSTCYEIFLLGKYWNIPGKTLGFFPGDFYIDVVLVFLLLTSNIFRTFSSVSIVDFEQVNVSWVTMLHFISMHSGILQQMIQNPGKALNEREHCKEMGENILG